MGNFGTNYYNVETIFTRFTDLIRIFWYNFPCISSIIEKAAKGQVLLNSSLTDLRLSLNRQLLFFLTYSDFCFALVWQIAKVFTNASSFGTLKI